MTDLLVTNFAFSYLTGCVSLVGSGIELSKFRRIFLLTFFISVRKRRCRRGNFTIYIPRKTRVPER